MTNLRDLIAGGYWRNAGRMAAANSRRDRRREVQRSAHFAA
jgi:hypothetical protein